MRSDLVFVALVALALVQMDHEGVTTVQLAQTGPVPTSVVNPRLGAPPSGGHLGATTAGGVRPPASAGDPGHAADRVGAMNGGHLGGPAGNAPSDPPAGAVPPPATGAVVPPAAGAVPPATGLGR